MSDATALQEWKPNDSAFVMVQKYNAAIQRIVENSNDLGQIKKIKAEIKTINESLENKIESITAEDLGLGSVDNTSDMDKPVSKAQRIAIDNAVEEGTKNQLTSVPASRSLGGVL